MNCEKVMNKERTKMKTLITRLGPVYLRKNPDHKGYWDVLETRAGKVTGNSTFTGTLAEVRQTVRLGLLQY